MHSCLSMNLFATFAFLLPGHPTLSTTFDYLKQRKKTAEKIDTNAQWFHCSWSILLKRVNIRVRGFHLVFLKEVADASHTTPRRYFPERHIPVVKLLIKKPPAEDSYESNDKPVVISYEGSHSLPGWLQFLSEHTDLNLQEILDGNYQDYVKETCTQAQPRCSCHNWTLASPGSSD